MKFATTLAILALLTAGSACATDHASDASAVCPGPVRSERAMDLILAKSKYYRAALVKLDASPDTMRFADALVGQVKVRLASVDSQTSNGAYVRAYLAAADRLSTLRDLYRKQWKKQRDRYCTSDTSVDTDGATQTIRVQYFPFDGTTSEQAASFCVHRFLDDID